MTATFYEVGPYIVLLLVGFVPNEMWRMLAVVLAHGLDEGSEVLIWVKAVATGIIGGVIAQLFFSPPGTLAQIPLSLRLTAAACGLIGYYVIRRSVLAGVVVGEVVLLTGRLYFTP